MTENTKNTEKMLQFRPSVLAACFKDQQGQELIGEAHLEGLVMQKCSGRELFYSNAFMVATGKTSDIVTEKYYRIQDRVFFRAFSKICHDSNFCNEKSCKQNDATAAEYVLECKPNACEKYKELENISPVQDEKKTRTGIHYICPQTKLDEIAFPVKLYDRYMGVLIVGQISSKENRPQLEARIQEKLSTNNAGENSAESIFSQIKKVENMPQLINKIVNTVLDIEEGLISYYKERQDQYIFEKSNELIIAFKNDIETKENDSSVSEKLLYPTISHIKYYNKIGTCIKTRLHDFCKTVGIKKYIVFTPDFENLGNNAYDKIKGAGNSVFHFNNWRAANQKDSITGNLTSYISGISNDLDLLLVADSPTYPIALAVNSRDFLQDVSGGEKNLLQWTFGEVFKKFAEYSQMAGLEAKSDYYRSYLDSFMSIQRHELGQSNAGYEMLIEEFKKRRHLFEKEIMELGILKKVSIPVKEFLKHSDDFIADSEGYLYTTKVRTLSSKYLLDFSVEQKIYFYPYETFLFKWNHIYDVQARSKNLEFLYPQVNSTDADRPLMYGDPLMIEQAVYNLTNNAMKYALHGTVVSLNSRLNRTENRYEIIVENLGAPLKSENEAKTIFQYGQRGSNNEKEGNGLGLFLTKQIAKAHRGDVFCQTETLSPYNWGILQLYIKYFEGEKSRSLCNDEQLYLELKKEWKEKQREISHYSAGSMQETDFTPLYVHQNILNGTAKFKFTFWIPYQK